MKVVQGTELLLGLSLECGSKMAESTRYGLRRVWTRRFINKTKGNYWQSGTEIRGLDIGFVKRPDSIDGFWSRKGRTPKSGLRGTYSQE